MSSVRRVAIRLLASVGLLVLRVSLASGEPGESSAKGRGTILKLFVALGAAALALVLTPVANAQERTLTTFVAVLSAENEGTGCLPGVESGANGVAIIQIDETTGEISYRVVATNLPGTIAGSPGAHIHIGDATETGGVVLPLLLTGANIGVVAVGTVTNPTLADAILADPGGYYVNVHTTVCTGGAVRGQLG